MTTAMHRSPLALGLLLMISGSAFAAPAPTVADVTYSNSEDLSSWFMGKSPSILRVTESAPLPANAREAIANYDRVAELSAIRSPLRAESLRRAAYLRLRLVESDLGTPDELARAIEQYRRVLAEMPDDPANDLALYQLARAEQLAGNNDGMVALLAQLDQRYPQSALRSDALFRAAETLYLAKDYAGAEARYRSVLDIGKAAPQFDAAQYKYGWTLYQQGKYAAAVPVFVGILERSLPGGEPTQLSSAVVMPGAGNETMTESLRVLSLSFAALGGGPAINRYLAANAEPKFFVTLYAALGAQMLDLRRYSEAAQTYRAFVERYPQHRLAPAFDEQAIAAYRDGGFNEPMLALKESFVGRYAPDAAYWSGRSADPATLDKVKTQLGELAAHAHAQAQQIPASDATQRQQAYRVAAGYYQRELTLFPDHAGAAKTTMRLADTLLDASQYTDAARQYERSAYAYPAHEQTAEAGYAAVQAWQQVVSHVADGQRPAALQSAIDSSLMLAEKMPTHPMKLAAIASAAQNRYELKDHAGAIQLAQSVIAGSATAQQQRDAWTVIADAQFAQNDYAAAEASYRTLLAQAARPSESAARLQWSQRLAVSLYKRGELARSGGQLREAASLFEQASVAAPDPLIRAPADYDAASAYYSLEDWPATQRSFERFLSRNTEHALTADAESKLALAYERGGQLSAAAAMYQRVAQRPTTQTDLRREASWLSANLYDRAQARGNAMAAYSSYVASYPLPLMPAQRARQRLADYSSNAPEQAAQWLQAIVDADQRSGSREAESRQLAAAASLQLGRTAALTLARMPLRGALKDSLAQRIARTKAAVELLERAAAFGFAETTTAATYELGSLYLDLGRALLSSERPARLSDDEREQYELLLEEQTYPFEEKAIAAYESNLSHLNQDLWNEWVRRSALALATLVPVKYGKQDEREMSYDALF
ncbi:MAG: tetratricopeptide repeat protein [Pseudomonadota bacterium]|nr:tetratricopeptide repeat protein [Pseudomonadota bacterium]